MNREKSKALEICAKNQRECDFRTLSRKVGKFYKYTSDDYQEIYDSYLADPVGVVKALKEQATAVDTFIEYGMKDGFDPKFYELYEKEVKHD